MNPFFGFLIVFGVWILGAIPVFIYCSWNNIRDREDGPGAFAFMWPFLLMILIMFIIPSNVMRFADAQIKSLRQKADERKQRRFVQSALDRAKPFPWGYRDNAGKSCHECGQNIEEI